MDWCSDCRIPFPYLFSIAGASTPFIADPSPRRQDPRQRHHNRGRTEHCTCSAFVSQILRVAIAIDGQWLKPFEASETKQWVTSICCGCFGCCRQMYCNMYRFRNWKQITCILEMHGTNANFRNASQNKTKKTSIEELLFLMPSKHADFSWSAQ